MILIKVYNKYFVHYSTYTIKRVIEILKNNNVI